MFKTLKNQFAKMLMIFGGIVILIIFSGIFAGAYFSSQKEIEYTLKKSLITASKEDIVPEKEECVFLLIYVEKDSQNNSHIIFKYPNVVDYDILQNNYVDHYSQERTAWFDSIALSIAKNKNEDHTFKLNKRYYTYDFIEYDHPSSKDCFLYAVLDYTNYVSNNDVTFISLLIGYFFVILLLSFSAVFIADKTVSPIQEAFEKQKELIANASHELKTPLTVINTNLSVLENNKDRTIASQNRWFNNISEQTSRMNNLIYQMLDLSKTENLLQSENKEVVDLTEMLQKLVMEFEVNAFEKTIEINLQANEIILFNCNRENILKLFTILLENAIKYTNLNGTINIYLAQKKNKIEFFIQNSGKGIAKENLNKIFQRFYKQDESYKKDSNHSFGLGLAIAKAIVDQLNGTITVESEENVSTTFYVKIPIK